MGRWRFFKLPEYFLEKKDKYRFLLIILLPLKKKLKEVCFFTFLRDISKKSLILIVIEFSFFHTQGLSWDWYYGVCLNFRAYFFCRSRQSSIIINSQIYVKVHDFNLETLYAKYALKTRLLHAYIILFDANLSRWLDIEVTFWSLIEKNRFKYDFLSWNR